MARVVHKAAIRDNNPIAFLEHKALYFVKGPVPDGEIVVPIGKARVARQGTHVTLISYSKAIELALGAADVLAREGIGAEVIDLRTLFYDLDAPVQRITAQDAPVPYNRVLERTVLPQVEAVVTAVRALVSGKAKSRQT